MKNIKSDQRGLASIMFALFMIILLSLITIGFAQLVRKDQRQTLDKTLSNQAQFAAELAINRVQSNITTLAPMNDCAANPVVTGGSINIKDIPAEFSGVEITCLTYNKSPGNLSFSAVNTSPQVAPLKPAGAPSFTSLTFTWSDPNGNNKKSQISTGLNYVTNNAPTLRITITYDATGPNSGNTKTIYAVPGSGPSTGTGAITDDGKIFSGNCTVDGVCKITLSVPNIFNGYLSLMSLNGTSRVDVSPQDATVKFADAQVLIDATAKSQDVIKRLVATVPTSPTGWQPGFAANASTLCKNYIADGTNTDNGPAFSKNCFPTP